MGLRVVRSSDWGGEEVGVGGGRHWLLQDVIVCQDGIVVGHPCKGGTSRGVWYLPYPWGADQIVLRDG